MTGMVLTLVLGLTFIVGALVIKMFTSRVESIEEKSVALAFGAMVAIVLFDLAPEILLETRGWDLLFALVLVVVGVGILKALDHFIPEHEEHGDKEGNLEHIGLMSAMALMLHNVVEGMTVATVASSSFSSGLSLAIGVGLHNIPMGMFIYSAIRHETRPRKLLVLGLMTLSTFLGGVLMALISSFIGETFFLVLTALALGMVVYILFFELLPSFLEGRRSRSSYVFILLGVVLVLVASFLE